uniref:F-box domain-containing protein n=1 Tax=Plectus sambesii TaxID=2011161 RepID=A0A914XQ59_9BILA
MFGVASAAHVRPSVNFKGTAVGRRPITPETHDPSTNEGRCQSRSVDFDPLDNEKQQRQSSSVMAKISHCCTVAKSCIHLKGRGSTYKNLKDTTEEVEDAKNIMKLPVVECTPSVATSLHYLQSLELSGGSECYVKRPLLLQHLPDKTLLHVLRFLRVRDIMNCQRTCKRIDRLIIRGSAQLPKITIEQLKLHFEDGEVLLYSDDNLCEEVRRYPMPSCRQLPALLRHLTIRSLFIRGLIPEETRPVLHRLVHPSLRIDPSEAYFLWCNFGSDINDRGALIELCHRYFATIRHLAFEECGPPVAISDQTVIAACELNSLSVSSDGRHGVFPITDEALETIAAQHTIFSSIDLSYTQVTSEGVLALIKAWTRNPVTNSTINLIACKFIKLHALFAACAAAGIDIDCNRSVHINGYTLALCIQ